MLTVTYYPVLGVRYKLRSVKWRAIRHFLQRTNAKETGAGMCSANVSGIAKGDAPAHR